MQFHSSKLKTEAFIVYATRNLVYVLRYQFAAVIARPFKYIADFEIAST